MPQVMEPRPPGEAVRRVGAGVLAALAARLRLGGWPAAGAGVRDGLAPAGAEGVPLGDAADPVCDDVAAGTEAEPFDVAADLLQDPVVGGDGAGRCLGLELGVELAALGLGGDVDPLVEPVDAGVEQAERLAL